MMTDNGYLKRWKISCDFVSNCVKIYIPKPGGSLELATPNFLDPPPPPPPRHIWAITKKREYKRK